MPNSFPGFILTRQWRDTPRGVRVDLWLATDSGPVEIRLDARESVFFVLRRECEKIKQLLNESGFNNADYRSASVAMKTPRNLAVDAIYFRQHKRLNEARQLLQRSGLRCWESDIRPPERLLMERYIFAGIEVSGEIDRAAGYPLDNPAIAPSRYKPQLRVVSLDIETSLDARQLYSIAVWSESEKKVFIVADAGSVQASDSIDIEVCATERLCLQRFLNWLERHDPDVIIGWNLIQFDLWVLECLCQRLKLPFTLGRNQQKPYWRQESDGERRFISLPGRVALDGIDLLKTAFYNFASFSLQNVAFELLGQGKLIQGNSRGEEITHLYNRDKLALARYNLKDCELVWDIFAATDLLDFAIERSQLTGMKMDRMGGSAASFDYAYLPKLHRAGYVAPSLGELQSDIVSPGGYVMDSSPGLYDNVLVLDFKSLYPSIIRTFKIDPAGFWLSADKKLSGSKVVDGFNGARFAKKGHLLPDIIAELWARRDAAKRDKNNPLSQAIKILMNSFYGVLGSPVCRFFDPRISSSITLRGHEIIQTTKQWIEEQGLQVIYGDTDSVFVWLDRNCSVDAAMALGAELAQSLNARWQNDIAERFGVESVLELEFETLYRRFLMPTIRGSEEGSKKRYAGTIETDGTTELVFKGLESVRTDWTALAKDFQRELYRRIFASEPFTEYIRQTVERLLAGECDEHLIYRKRLRRQLHEYKRNIPPQVQAAKKLVLERGADVRRGDWVEYIFTLDGPEPVQAMTAAIDYDRYIERQLAPVADSILQFSGTSFAEIVDKQIGLF